MISKIYDSNKPVWALGSRKGKSRTWIERDNNYQNAPTKKKAKNFISPRVSPQNNKTILMKQMLKGDNLNTWEKQFIHSCLQFKSLSQKQKDVLNKIYKKFKNKVA